MARPVSTAGSCLSWLAGLGLTKRKLSVVFVAAAVVAHHRKVEIGGLAGLGSGPGAAHHAPHQTDRAQQLVTGEGLAVPLVLS